MISRGLRLTGMRRALLSALVPGRGVAADELKRAVALSRDLSPEKSGWPSFNSSFARALRLLEGAGALEVRREDTLFGEQACATWVRLTDSGETARAKLVAADEHGLGHLTPESSLLADLRRVSDAELTRIETLVALERSRRALEASPQ